jgi:hypothetical protein
VLLGRQPCSGGLLEKFAMFDLMYNNLVWVVEFNLDMQQNFFKKWAGLRPGGPHLEKASAISS